MQRETVDKDVCERVLFFNTGVRVEKRSWRTVLDSCSVRRYSLTLFVTTNEWVVSKWRRSNFLNDETSSQGIGGGGSLPIRVCIRVGHLGLNQIRG